MCRIEGINADHRCSELESTPDFLSPTRGENRIDGINADQRCSEFGVGSQFPAASLWRETRWYRKLGSDPNFTGHGRALSPQCRQRVAAVHNPPQVPSTSSNSVTMKKNQPAALVAWALSNCQRNRLAAPVEYALAAMVFDDARVVDRDIGV